MQPGHRLRGGGGKKRNETLDTTGSRGFCGLGFKVFRSLRGLGVSGCLGVEVGVLG